MSSNAGKPALLALGKSAVRRGEGSSMPPAPEERGTGGRAAGKPAAGVAGKWAPAVAGKLAWLRETLGKSMPPR